ncbi:unnamed protein product [Coffea canephora]|uniref:Uncharacterized protein n=1 Tax=Coffea canephora TaxID=49390 RepID=A0A068TRD6_COFCA|nr:unnamed protein product [Coffea canephora]
MRRGEFCHFASSERLPNLHICELANQIQNHTHIILFFSSFCKGESQHTHTLTLSPSFGPTATENAEKMDGHDGDASKQSTADMTAFVQNLLQQMQSRFQAMSESIITKNILPFYPCPFC